MASLRLTDSLRDLLGLRVVWIVMHVLEAAHAGLGTGHLRPEVPPGADGEIRRVLSATTWYEVLEVSPDADAAVIKRSKHAKALLTHPDKTRGAVGAHEAAQRVNMVRTADRRADCTCGSRWPSLNDSEHERIRCIIDI